MTTRREIKIAAQDSLLLDIANGILGTIENDLSDVATINEMYVQATRVMRLFGVDSFPGLGTIDHPMTYTPEPEASEE